MRVCPRINALVDPSKFLYHFIPNQDRQFAEYYRVLQIYKYIHTLTYPASKTSVSISGVFCAHVLQNS